MKNTFITYILCAHKTLNVQLYDVLLICWILIVKGVAFYARISARFVVCAFKHTIIMNGNEHFLFVVFFDKVFVKLIKKIYVYNC